MSLSFSLSDITTEIKVGFMSKQAVIAHAATSAARAAGNALIERGRANIAAAGFGAKWQKTWRVKFFPDKSESIDAVAFCFHKIPYSGIFETGGTIRAQNGMLWLPLQSTVKKVGRNRATPRVLAAQGVKFITIQRPGRPPLLAATVKVSKAEADNPNLSLSVTRLRNGMNRKTGVARAVPLFVGLSSVTIRKRFNISALADEQRGRLSEYYDANLNPDG